jgi:hypothetical protein
MPDLREHTVNMRRVPRDKPPSRRSEAARFSIVVAVIMLGILATSDEPVRSALIYTPIAVAFALIGFWIRRRRLRRNRPSERGIVHQP